MREILVEYVNPPIPDRRFDYCATWDDYEPGDAQGWGRTESEAISNLTEEDQE